MPEPKGSGSKEPNLPERGVPNVGPHVRDVLLRREALQKGIDAKYLPKISALRIQAAELEQSWQAETQDALGKNDTEIEDARILDAQEGEK